MKKIVNKTQQIIKSIKTLFIRVVGCQFKKICRYRLIPMRELSECEKYVVKKLVQWEYYLDRNPHDWHSQSLASIFSRFAYNQKTGFSIDKKTNSITLKASTLDLRSLLAKANKFRRDFITITHFIDYLHKENLLFTVPQHKDATKIPNRIDWTEKNFGYRSDEVQIKDIEFYNLLSRYYNKALIPTEYLVKYYKQNFKTDEEVRFDKNINKVNESIEVAKKSLKAAWNGVYVAIFIGLISIGIGLIGMFKPNNDTKIILDVIYEFEKRTEIQFDKLEGNDKKMNLRLDKLEKQVNEIINKKSMDKQ